MGGISIPTSQNRDVGHPQLWLRQGRNVRGLTGRIAANGADSNRCALNGLTEVSAHYATGAFLYAVRGNDRDAAGFMDSEVSAPYTTRACKESGFSLELLDSAEDLTQLNDLRQEAEASHSSAQNPALALPGDRIGFWWSLLFPLLAIQCHRSPVEIKRYYKIFIFATDTIAN